MNIISRLAFAKKALPILLARFTGIGLAFLVTLILGRFLGPESFGEYSYYLSIGNIVIVIIGFGFPIHLLKSTASANTAQKRTELASLILFSTLSIIFFGSIFFLFSFFFLKDNYLIWILVFSFSSLSALLFLWTKFLEGQNKVLYGQIQQTVTYRIIFILVILFSTIVIKETNELDVKTALLSNNLSLLLTLIISIFLGLYFFLPQIDFKKVQFKFDLKFFKNSYPFALLGIVFAVFGNINVILVAELSTKTEAGIYQIAYQIAFLASFGLLVANAINAPRFAKFWAENNKKSLQNVLSQTTIFATVFCCISTLVIIIFGHSIITLGFGIAYSGAYLPMLILLISQAVGTFFGPGAMLLSMTGNEKIATRAILFSIIINIVFAFIFIPDYGSLGAALSRSIAVLFSLFYMFFYIYKNLGFNSSILNINTE